MNHDTPLRRFRSYLGVSQETLAESLGVTRGHISHLELGFSLPGPNLLIDLVDVYRVQLLRCDITLEDILRGTFRHDGRRTKKAA